MLIPKSTFLTSSFVLFYWLFSFFLGFDQCLSAPSTRKFGTLQLRTQRIFGVNVHPFDTPDYFQTISKFFSRFLFFLPWDTKCFLHGFSLSFVNLCVIIRIWRMISRKSEVCIFIHILSLHFLKLWFLVYTIHICHG